LKDLARPGGRKGGELNSFQPVVQARQEKMGEENGRQGQGSSGHVLRAEKFNGEDAVVREVNENNGKAQDVKNAEQEEAELSQGFNGTGGRARVLAIGEFHGREMLPPF
jgi:hypothetical protein